MAALPARFAEVAACGMPDTLVHGDYHPGNVRGEPGNLTMLDWGDTGVGQPLLDMPAFLAGRAAGEPSRGSASTGSTPGEPPSRAATPSAPPSSSPRSPPAARP